MNRNVGTIDRIIRLVIGVMLLGLYGALEPPLRYFTLIGLDPLGTAILGHCPLSLTGQPRARAASMIASALPAFLTPGPMYTRCTLRRPARSASSTACRP